MPSNANIVKKHVLTLVSAIGLQTPPVPVEEVAQYIGATINIRDLADDSLCGMVIREPNGSIIIGVNENQLETRRRFTIAHEIGHIILHSNERIHIDESLSVWFRNEESSLGTNRKEVEANQFAAELLMPTSFLLKDVSGITIDAEGDKIIHGLANKYNVSVQAMTIRLSRLAILR